MPMRIQQLGPVVTLQDESEQRGEQQEPATHLLKAAIAAASALTHVIAKNPGKYDDDFTFYYRLQSEFERFIAWNKGFNLGELDLILSKSDVLRIEVLGFMVNWVKVLYRSKIISAVSKINITLIARVVPKVLPDYPWSSALQNLDKLENLAQKIGQVVDAAEEDIRLQYGIRNNDPDLDSSFESKLDSSCESDLDSSYESSFDTIIQDFEIYFEGLIEWTSALEALWLEGNPTTETKTRPKTG